ncbi:MAG: riboflavin synthase subunit alpha [Gammaproteobacteria bacterium]
MFTGIIQDLVPVTWVEHKGNAVRFSLTLSISSLTNLHLGASLAVDGVCLTVAHIEGNEVFFDVMAETLSITTLKTIQVGQYRNIERSLSFGSEIGGHILSGHVIGEATISHIEKGSNELQINTFQCNPNWMKYILTKGFIALDGASLTIVDPSPHGTFKIHFIPETIKRTTLGQKIVGSQVNLEIDPQTQAIVDTVEKVLAERQA